MSQCWRLPLPDFTWVLIFMVPREVEDASVLPRGSRPRKRARWRAMACSSLARRIPVRRHLAVVAARHEDKTRIRKVGTNGASRRSGVRAVDARPRSSPTLVPRRGLRQHRQRFAEDDLFRRRRVVVGVACGHDFERARRVAVLEAEVHEPTTRELGGLRVPLPAPRRRKSRLARCPTPDPGAFEDAHCASRATSVYKQTFPRSIAPSLALRH